jgi:hypothetical protein
MVGKVAHNELKRMWKDMFIASGHFPGGTEENHNTSVIIAVCWAKI